MVLLVLIKAYQFLLSPLFGERCRFYPSCSQYTVDALKARGVMMGIWFAAKRICRCHPGCEGGYDPIVSSSPRRRGSRVSSLDPRLRGEDEITESKTK